MNKVCCNDIQARSNCGFLAVSCATLYEKGKAFNWFYGAVQLTRSPNYAQPITLLVRFVFILQSKVFM